MVVWPTMARVATPGPDPLSFMFMTEQDASISPEAEGLSEGCPTGSTMPVLAQEASRRKRRIDMRLFLFIVLCFCNMGSFLDYSLDYARDDIARDDSGGYSIWQRTARPSDIQFFGVWYMVILR